MEDQPLLQSGDGRIRFIIFLVSGVYWGLPALVWAAWTLRQHHLRGRRSIFLITLLFIDAMELLLIPFVIVAMLSPAWMASDLICIIFFLIRFLGLHHHQLVALEGIVSLTHPRCSTLLSRVPCYMALTLTTVLSVALTIIYPLPSLYATLFVLPAVAMVTMCVLMRPVRTCPQQSAMTDRPERMVVVISLVTLFCLYAPSLLTLPISHSKGCLPFPSVALGHDQFVSVWDSMTVSVMSLRLIADPLLCVLVCRLPRMQPTQESEADDRTTSVYVF